MNDYMAYYDPGDGVRQAEFETASMTVERTSADLLERGASGGGKRPAGQASPRWAAEHPGTRSSNLI